MVSAGLTEARGSEILIHRTDDVLQIRSAEGYPAVMTLLEVCIKGVLKASGAVKDDLPDVHTALCKNSLQFLIGQTVLRLSCYDLRCQRIKSRHTPTHIC